MGKFMRILCALALLSAFSTVAFAQDDDQDSFDGTVDFESPSALEPGTEFEFGFIVENTSNSTNNDLNWICEADLFLPSSSYTLPLDGVSDPDALHGGTWIHDIDFDTNNRIVIMWMHSGLSASSSATCDIREGEALGFAFKAVTDENATDGFGWRLYASGGASLMGTAYVGTEGDDDDADDDDDVDDDISDDDTDNNNEWPSADDDADSDDGSDTTSIGCGC